MHVIQPVRWFGTENPIAGRLRINYPVPFEVFLEVIPDANGSGLPGVRIAGSGQQAEKTWDDFEDLPDTAPEWQQAASYGYAVFRFFFKHFAIAFDNFEYFVDQNRNLENAGGAGLTEACDTFPGPPPIAGSRKMVWNDLNGNRELDPGDGFTVTYTNCWIDDPDDVIDEFFRGTLKMTGYIEGTSPYFKGGIFTLKTSMSMKLKVA